MISLAFVGLNVMVPIQATFGCTDVHHNYDVENTVPTIVCKEGIIYCRLYNAFGVSQ